MKLKEQMEDRIGVVHLYVDNIQLDEELENCLIWCFTGRFPAKQALFSLIKSWLVKHKIEFHPSGWIIFKFPSILDLEKVISYGPHFAFGQILILKKLHMFFDFGPEEMTFVPVWVKFPNLPVSLWTEEFLSKICQQLESLSWLIY